MATPSSTLRLAKLPRVGSVGQAVTRGGTSDARRRARKRQRGITLIELLIVVTLAGMMVAAVMLGSGFLGSAKLRAAGGLVTNTVRVGVAHANTTGHPVRVVFDLDHHRIILEESADKMLREKSEDDTTGGAEVATEAEKEAREYAKEILDGPRAPRARFKPIDVDGVESIDGEPGRSLQGIKFRQVQTAHDTAPVTTGRAYLYIWPGGDTERAAIQIYQGADDIGLTVTVHALTGRAKIHKGQIELEEPRADDEFGEREED